MAEVPLHTRTALNLTKRWLTGRVPQGQTVRGHCLQHVVQALVSGGTPVARQGKRDWADGGWGRLTGSAGAGGRSGRKWASMGLGPTRRWSESRGQCGSASENPRL